MKRQAEWTGNIHPITLLIVRLFIIFFKATETNKNIIHHLKLVYTVLYS